MMPAIRSQILSATSTDRAWQFPVRSGRVRLSRLPIPNKRHSRTVESVTRHGRIVKPTEVTMLWPWPSQSRLKARGAALDQIQPQQCGEGQVESNLPNTVQYPFCFPGSGLVVDPAKPHTSGSITEIKKKTVTVSRTLTHE